MRLVSIGLRTLVVLTQVRVEGALAMSWSIVKAQTTGRVADVGVTAASVIHVDDGFRMDVG